MHMEAEVNIKPTSVARHIFWDRISYWIWSLPVGYNGWASKSKSSFWLCVLSAAVTGVYCCAQRFLNVGTLKLGPHGCGGLNENSPHRLKYLNTFTLSWCKCWGRIRCGLCVTRDGVWNFRSPRVSQFLSLSLPYACRSGSKSMCLPASCHAPHHDAHGLPSETVRHQIKCLFYKLHLLWFLSTVLGKYLRHEACS